MHISTLTEQQLQCYRALRRDGVDAASAYRSAVDAQCARLGYRVGPGERITFVLDDRPGGAGFVLTARSVPDPDADLSWLGEFTTDWSPEAVELTARENLAGSLRGYRYFVPDYRLAQRRADLSARGLPTSWPNAQSATMPTWPARSRTASSSSKRTPTACFSARRRWPPTSARTSVSMTRLPRWFARAS